MKYLNESQLERFNKTLKRSGNLRDILIFELTIYFGLRVSELLNLRVSHIDFTNQQLTIQGSKGGYKRTYANVSEKLLKKVAKYIKEFEIEDQLFMISRQSIYKLFKKYLRSAKIDGRFSPHSLRHSTAFLMIRNGASPYEVRNWLRHKSIMSTQVYFENIAFENLGGKVSKMFSDIF